MNSNTFSLFFFLFVAIGQAIESTSPERYKEALIWCDGEEVGAERRIYVDMVADLFHPGYVAFLRQVKELGGCLIVGLCGDADCES